MYGIIYKVTGPTGLVYIGKTRGKLRIRKNRHKRSVSLGENWGRFPAALRDIGFDNFAWEQIDQAESREELNQKEKYWIAFYRSIDPACGYNVSPGGDVVADESRRKMSQSQRGKKKSPEHRRKIGLAHKGKKHPPEFGKKVSAAKKGTQAGKDNPFYGKHHTEETRQRMREVWAETHLINGKPGNDTAAPEGNDMGYSVSPAKGGKVAVYRRGRKVHTAENEAAAWAWIARQVRAGK